MNEPKKPSIQTLGGVEHVNFPKQNLYGVPARVDTGAKTSAVWAGDMLVDDDGKLHFKLFSKQSHLHNDHEIIVKEYSRITVLSSNGIAEDRYKVKLLVEVGNRKIKASFTLTDRSLQTYPVLVGRNILRGKFIVDVKQKPKLKS